MCVCVLFNKVCVSMCVCVFVSIIYIFIRLLYRSLKLYNDEFKDESSGIHRSVKTFLQNSFCGLFRIVLFIKKCSIESNEFPKEIIYFYYSHLLHPFSILKAFYHQLFHNFFFMSREWLLSFSFSTNFTENYLI